MKYNNKNIIPASVSFILLMALPFHAALSAGNIFESKKGTATVYMSVGQADVKANELVYCQPPGCPTKDYKLSHLIWEVKNNPILIAGLSFTRDKSRFSVEFQRAISEEDGVMDDYDWLYIDRDWSHWSHHEDTSLEEFKYFDINYDYLFYGKTDNAWRFLIGYRESTWAWEARGGSYIYSTIPTDFRDDIGYFPAGERGIFYEQEFSMPYIGIKYEAHTDKWRFHLQYEYSNWVSLNDTDHHYYGDLLFLGDFKDGDMTGYKVEAAYKFDRHLEGFIRYDARDYEELRGGTTYRVASTGALYGICEDCAGADNTNSSLSIGISYNY